MSIFVKFEIIFSRFKNVPVKYIATYCPWDSHQIHSSCTSMSLWWQNNLSLWLSWTVSIPKWVSIHWHAACAPSDAKLLEGGVHLFSSTSLWDLIKHKNRHKTWVPRRIQVDWMERNMRQNRSASVTTYTYKTNTVPWISQATWYVTPFHQLLNLAWKLLWISLKYPRCQGSKSWWKQLFLTSWDKIQCQRPTSDASFFLFQLDYSHT